MVNPNAAPLEIGNAASSEHSPLMLRSQVVCVCVCSSEDTQRSGLWLLPVYVNHSCLPNALTSFAPKRDMVNPGDLSRAEPKVQRLIVLDCLFLRAGPGLGIQPVATA